MTIAPGLSGAQRDVLLELGTLMSERHSVGEAFDAFAGLLLAPGGADFAMLGAIEADGRLVTITGNFPESAAGVHAGETFRADQAGVTALMRLPGGEAAYDTASTPFDVPRHLSSSGYPHAWSIVLMAEGEAVGIFTAARAVDGPFSDDQLSFLREATKLLGAAMRHDLHFAALERQAVRSSLLNDLAVLLNAGESVDALFGRMLQLLERAIPFDFILLFARDGDELRLVGQQPAVLARPGRKIPITARRVQVMAAQLSGVEEYRPDRISGPWMDAIASVGGRRGLGAILREGEEVLGIFTLGRTRNAPFQAEERAFVEVVTTLLKQAIANEYRLHRVEAEAARSQLLNELSIKLSDGESVEALFDELPFFLGRALQFDYVGLAAFSGDDGQMRTLYWMPGREEGLQESSVDPRDIGLPTMLTTDAAVVEFAVQDAAGGIAPRFAAAGFRRSAIAKLQYRATLIGVLHLSRLANRPFAAEDLAFLEVVATLFAQAVASKLRVERTIAEATEQRVIAEFSATAARERDAASLLKGMLGPLQSAIPDPGVAFVFLEASGMLYCDAFGGRVVLEMGRYARAAMQGDQVVVGIDALGASPTALALALADGMESLVLTPARSGGEVVGMFVVGTRKGGYTFSEDDLRLLSSMAQIVGPAMANVITGEHLAAEAREQRVIAEIAAIAAREDQLPKLIGTLWQPLRQLVPKPFLAFGFIEGEAVLYPREDGTMKQAPLDEHSREALLEGQIHGPLDPSELPPDNGLVTRGVKAVAVTAARSGGEIIGLLLAGSCAEGYRFGERELRVLRILAQVIGPAMVNARAAARSRIEAEDQGILADIGTAVAHEADPMALLQAAVAPLRRIIPRPLLGYGHIEDGSTVYDVPGLGEVKLPITPAEEQAIRDGQLVTGPLRELLPEGHHGHQWGVEAAVATARYSGGIAKGILIVGSREEGFTFGERELHLCRRILQIIGPAMETARASTNQARQVDLYNLVLSSLTEAVVLLDEGGEIVFANPAAERLRAVFDPLRKNASVERVVPLLPGEMRAAFHQAAHQGRESRGRTAVTLDGQQAWFDFEFVPLDGAEVRLLIVATDATAAVRREEEEARHREEMAHASRLAALGELVGGVAHELNNPLTAILGFAEVSQLSPAGEGLREELGIIQKEALRARNIVRDLLFIARPGPGERNQVNLAEVLAHIERLRRAEWVRAGFEATVELPAERYDLRGNENQITQLLLNLVTNAEQALAGRPQPRLAIAARVAADQIEITVTDNGHGMDAATARRVFEPFFTTKQGVGTGLGLSLSYSIVTSHNGTIDVDSTPGVGTTFHVSLPLEAKGETLSGSAALGVTPQRARVLVIDDEPSLRRVCQRLIASMGHDCEVAGDSATALRLTLADENQFDLILCDYRLVSDTADTVIDAIALRRPALLARTVIATGAASDVGVVDIVTRHRLRLISKPYGIDEISALIAANRRIEPLSA